MAETETAVGADASAEVATNSKHLLVSKLDELLERYLGTLDDYQKAQQQLTTCLSSGYLSLAYANFNNTRARFGQDYYDERMQATRTVSWDTREDTAVPLVSALSAALSSDLASGSATQESEAEPSLQPRVSNQEPAATQNGDDSELNEQLHNSLVKNNTPFADPIRWFGILVPSALRSAQAKFVDAVEGPIPQLVALARDLRQQEIDIGRLRKQIKKV